MSRRIYFITHPDVRIQPERAVPDWSLSETGLARMRAGLTQQRWMSTVSAIYASTERKAVEGAEVLSAALQLPVQQRAELSEVDRSATGYLPHGEHEATADQLFAHPDASARGWETARHAQIRISSAVEKLVAADSSSGSIAIVSHGAVGALLLCSAAGLAIARAHDQPGRGGGNFFVLSSEPLQLVQGWQRFDAPNL